MTEADGGVFAQSEQQHEDDRAYHGNGLVLPVQEGIGAFPDRRRDFLHPGVAGVLFQDPGGGEQAVSHAHRATDQRKTHNIHTIPYPPIK